jgi:hypothetical protein
MTPFGPTYYEGLIIRFVRVWIGMEGCMAGRLLVRVRRLKIAIRGVLSQCFFQIFKMNFGSAIDTKGGENVKLAQRGQNLFLAIVSRGFRVFLEIVRHYDWGERKKEKD